ncbi:MAG TPA: NmrA family NAD(P)-binding protein [Solirubrobacteraceae bacterium]|nr:NmrA family NAD(P)-binding protein [Solirubrobacteraceae bacterium]
MRILVTGVTGAIGSGLAPCLVDAGHEVRALTRRRDHATLPALPDAVTLQTGDAVSGIGLAEALRDVEVAFYLIHSMEPGGAEPFGVRERRSAENFAEAAAAAGVRRIVYLGGLVPDTAPSAHLASRLQVERILLETVPDSVALRASIVIGARSRSFRFLVHLIERMPILVIPAWGGHRTAPVDARDVLRCLTQAATDPRVGGRSLDIAGAEIVTYAQLITRIRDLMLLDRPTVRLPGLTLTPIASRVSAVIAEEEHALIGPLMAGLESDLLPRPALALELLGLRPHALDAAIERALRDWESTEPLRAR